MDPKEEIKKLTSENEQLRTEIEQLVRRNLQLSDQLCIWYEMRQRVNWLKEEITQRHNKTLVADLTDDSELLALIEVRIEDDPSVLGGDFGLPQMAELIGVSQARLIRLFRQSTIFKSAEDYLDHMRLLRALNLFRAHPQYSVVAVSEEAGFNSVRTLQRRMQEAIGMTPVEFRLLVSEGKGV